MTSEALRLIIRAKLADGRLPHSAETRIWGCSGVGEAICAACDQRITKDEFALHGAAPHDATRGPFQLHAGCFHVWREATVEQAMRGRVREALRHGGLTRTVGPGSSAGYGSEQPCHVCGEMIRRRDVEHEVVETGGPVLVHAACLLIWREESLGLSVDSTTQGVAAVVDLILKAPTCRRCIGAKLEPDVAKAALDVISKRVVGRTVPDPCSLCGSNDGVLSLQSPES